jgi:hypothetical protein
VGHGLAIRAYNLGSQANVEIRALTHEIIRRLISETPEHITGQEGQDIAALSEAYVENFYRILDDDIAARDEIMRLEQEYDVMGGTGADWDAMSGAPTSANNSQNIGEVIHEEADEQWRQGPGAFIDSQASSMGTFTQESIAAGEDMAVEEVARIGEQEGQSQSKKVRREEPFGGGKRRQTKKRKLTKRRKNKKSNNTKRNRKMTKRRR